ncbi:DNA-3-methyladenine glycosylase [Lutispora thermophila]|uniref:Putative 3-methyladenine DNA glycosylase n=1 Tax=Lutispora thermophila DSM 19022 TaxID=1122184 RepID=A0A1M6D8X2_9FIRM|nr:DNA-3-methyladenine glycosylase [Lutispora thermophila]SHI69601.1 DNA-3-methyladenine glycosylase [Lutispora thermophila DSM 19022]
MNSDLKSQLDLSRLDRSFYSKNAVKLSKDLLGKYLVHSMDGKELIGKIVEVEAYMGVGDKAAHSYNGRRTARTEVMYGEEGHAYVYLIYGMYYCLNVVAAKEGIAQAVLIRALEPIKGSEIMAVYRYGKALGELKKSQIINLTNGPGKLCKALNIEKEYNGEDLTGNRLFICENRSFKEEYDIVETKRIGIDYAQEAKYFPWRFYIKDNPYVSVK